MDTPYTKTFKLKTDPSPFKIIIEPAKNNICMCLRATRISTREDLKLTRSAVCLARLFLNIRSKVYLTYVIIQLKNSQ